MEQYNEANDLFDFSDTESVACDDCSMYADLDVTCHKCNKNLCDDCNVGCASCMKDHCATCVRECAFCSDALCVQCGIFVEGRRMCKRHLNNIFMRHTNFCNAVAKCIFKKNTFILGIVELIADYCKKREIYDIYLYKN